MFFSNLAMFFIIAVCGAVLFPKGITSINSAADAAAALQPLAGRYASLLFTLGIFGVGLLGIPVLAGSASYAVSESFGWKEGLHHKFFQAKAFYGVIIFSMLIGLSINFIGLDPIKALIYAAVFNGLVAPVILVLIVILAAKKSVMGIWANHRFTTFMGWVAAIVMIIVAAATIYSLF
jgi:Mn2+/Fe2+ NRAMP family transporter